ncbi:MAG TPA: PepSY-like domain-containing protein [Chitinophagaceae bacterium]|nr:PepSY-like domain-containing protein [Chitinophagaceae bacterium]
MKTIFVACSLFFFVAIAAQEKTKIPVEVKASFAKQFSGVKNIRWGKEDKNFEVDFLQGDKKMSALFDASGKLKETEESISKNELPSDVIPYFNQHYKNITIKETAKITKSDGEINFEIGTKGKDILFNASGSFIKEVKD